MDQPRIFFTSNILHFREDHTSFQLPVSWIVMASSYQLESHKQQEEEWINSRTQSPHHNYHQCQGPLLKTARITY